jgi:hypothetical protein
VSKALKLHLTGVAVAALNQGLVWYVVFENARSDRSASVLKQTKQRGRALPRSLSSDSISGGAKSPSLCRRCATILLTCAHVAREKSWFETMQSSTLAPIINISTRLPVGMLRLAVPPG